MVVEIALTCYPPSYVGSVLAHGSLPSIVLILVRFLSVLSAPEKNSMFLLLSSMFRRGSELSGYSESDETAVLVSWLLQIVNWDFIALFHMRYCLLCRVEEGAADVLRRNSVSLASVLCAFARCLYFSMIMFCSADSLASVVNSSLVSCSFLSSLQFLSKWSLCQLKSPKVTLSMLRRSLLLLCCSKSSFIAFHSITFRWSCCLRLFFTVDGALELFGVLTVIGESFILQSLYCTVFPCNSRFIVFVMLSRLF